MIIIGAGALARHLSYVSEDTGYDERGKPFQPQVHYFVGSATKLYGAALYRLQAVNRDCRAKLDNLYGLDTSVLSSIGAVNPVLTAMANSLRVGDHLLERLGARAGAAAAA